ncbi:sigma factor [Nonomuraea sp. NPDC026600]|uniref:sigma factor n=1 Tax=Nonomuraea sp. NPDC026600 TaxID=3155363 RepID=UPI0033ECD8DC
MEDPFESFVAARLAALYRYAMVLTGDRHDAEDLVQEALTRTGVHWRRVIRKDDPEGYVRTAMLRIMTNRWRRPRREVTVADPPEPAEEDSGLEGLLADASLRARLVRRRVVRHRRPDRGVVEGQPMISWPGGAKCAVVVTVNLDAEHFWLQLDESCRERPKTLSMGEYGPRRGVPRVLDALNGAGVTASWLMPGAVAGRYPDVAAEIADRGHEIGCRGLGAEDLTGLTPRGSGSSWPAPATRSRRRPDGGPWGSGRCRTRSPMTRPGCWSSSATPGLRWRGATM